MVKPVNRKQGQKYKNKCRSQNVSMTKAIPLLMQKVIDGEIIFRKNKLTQEIVLTVLEVKVK